MPVLDHVEFLVEEPSAEGALYNLVPKILGQDVSFTVYSHQGKLDLLKKLPSRLRGYRAWLPDNAGIVVLIDADGQDFRQQKTTLETAARQAGFLTRSSAEGGRFQVLSRLAIEELEAWFFGDVGALRAVYPGISSSLGERAIYRDPDAIRGGNLGGSGTGAPESRPSSGGAGEDQGRPGDVGTHGAGGEPLPELQAFRQGLLELVGGGVRT